MWIHTFISVPVCQKPIERGLSFVTRTAHVCLPLKYSLLYPWLKRCYLLSALREIIVWSHTSSALCKPGMSLFVCRWNIQMERIFDMVAYGYFGGFSSHKWLAYHDFWTSYYMKLGSIFPFFQDGHTNGRKKNNWNNQICNASTQKEKGRSLSDTNLLVRFASAFSFDGERRTINTALHKPRHLHGIGENLNIGRRLSKNR